MKSEHIYNVYEVFTNKLCNIWSDLSNWDETVKAYDGNSITALHRVMTKDNRLFPVISLIIILKIAYDLWYKTNPIML